MPDISVQWHSSDLENAFVCPACGGTPGKKRYENLHDRLEGVPGCWVFRECSDCRSLLLDPRPTLDSISKAYVSYYTHHPGLVAFEHDNGKSIFWALANGYMNGRFGSHRSPSVAFGKWLLPLLFPLRQQLDFFYRHLPSRPAKLLDVGCGNGVFLLRAKAAGWSVIGLEPDSVAAAGAHGCGVDVHCGTLDSFDSDDLFDVITTSHVIEHVHDPKAFLEKSFQLLREGGTLWLATPNVGGVGHWFFGRAWRGLEPPRHITVFTARALRKLLKSSGFCDIRFRRRGRGASYILNQSRKLSASKFIKPYFLPIIFVDLIASFFPTASEELVVTARKPFS